MKQNCQLCNGKDFKKLITVKDANFSSAIKAFDIYECNTCGLSVMNPFPNDRDIQELYVQENVFSQPVSNPYKKRFLFSFLEPLYRKYGADARFIAKTCMKYAKGAKHLLDIGCSTGTQIKSYLAIAPGLQTIGIDIDPSAKTNATEDVKEMIIIDDFTKHDFGDKQFDVISLKFVIEHLMDFHPYMEKINKLLKPGGLLFMSTPDISSAKALLEMDKWVLINDPVQKIGHLRWFNSKSMQYLAKKYNFEMKKLTNRGELIHHLPGWLQKILYALFGRDATGKRFIKYYPIRVSYAIFYDGILSQKIGYGDSLYAFMVKKETPAGATE